MAAVGTFGVDDLPADTDGSLRSVARAGRKDRQTQIAFGGIERPLLQDVTV